MSLREELHKNDIVCNKHPTQIDKNGIWFAPCVYMFQDLKYTFDLYNTELTFEYYDRISMAIHDIPIDGAVTGDILFYDKDHELIAVLHPETHKFIWGDVNIDNMVYVRRDKKESCMRKQVPVPDDTKLSLDNYDIKENVVFEEYPKDILKYFTDMGFPEGLVHDYVKPKDFTFMDYNGKTIFVMHGEFKEREHLNELESEYCINQYFKTLDELGRTIHPFEIKCLTRSLKYQADRIENFAHEYQIVRSSKPFPMTEYLLLKKLENAGLLFDVMSQIDPNNIQSILSTAHKIKQLINK